SGIDDKLTNDILDLDADPVQHLDFRGIVCSGPPPQVVVIHEGVNQAADCPLGVANSGVTAKSVAHPQRNPGPSEVVLGLSPRWDEVHRPDLLPPVQSLGAV